MKRWMVALWCGVGAAVLVLLTAFGVRAGRAQREAHREVVRFEAVALRVPKLRDLETSLVKPAGGEDPPGGLTGRVSDAIQHAGLPAAALASLSPEAEVAVGSDGASAGRRRATLVLTGVTLPQVGAFLHTWAGMQPSWTCLLYTSPSPRD